jgi:FtsH-binding integral membrane protein
MRLRTAAALDVCCVVVFVAIGRASHSEAASLAGFARTAWPFLVGLAAGWLITRAWRRPAAVAKGIGVWPVTVLAGMVLRAISGQGVAVAFVIVAMAFLGLELLGWRAIARVTATRTQPAGKRWRSL